VDAYVYTRAHDIRLGEIDVYTHTRVVIRLYYIDREKKNRERARAKGTRARGVRMCVCERKMMSASV